MTRVDENIGGLIDQYLSLRSDAHTNGEVKAGPVTREDVIAFLEGACRNWSMVPKLSEEDIGDVAMELLRFVTKRLPALEVSP